MNDDERLREALHELELIRGREEVRLHETRALLDALETLATSRDVDAGLTSLVHSIRNAMDCDCVVLFTRAGAGLRPLYATDAEVMELVWPAPGLLTRSRRIVDIAKVRGLWEAPPAALARWRSLLSVPVEDDAQRTLLAAFAEAPGKFTTSQGQLLSRLATVASQALMRRSLEERNGFLAAVIDRSPVSVAIADTAQAELPLIYVNAAFTDLTGYQTDEALGENCRFLSAEAQDAPVRRAIRETVETRGNGTFTLRNRRKDGTEFWNELRLFPIANAEGTPTHIVATQTDATSRIQAEIERDDARRRLEGALSATGEAFLILGRNGHIRFFNDSFASLFPAGAVAMDARVPLSVMSFVLGQPVVALPKTVAALPGFPVNREVTSRDGRQMLLRGRLIPSGGAVITATDVTEVKVNQRMLRQRLAAIERSQEGIAIGDLDGRIIDVNPSLLALWSVAREEEVLGRKWTRFYSNATQKQLSDSITWMKRNGLWLGEAEFGTGDAVRFHELSLSLVPEIGSVLIVRDVTERRRTEQERSELLRRLDKAQLQERMHQLSAGLAHDFNNLLSAILGSAALIESSTDLPEPTQKAVKRIQTAAKRAADLTDGFLDLGAREKSVESLDLCEVIQNTVDLAGGSTSSNVTFSVSVAEDPVRVMASQTDILQVVMNLVVNAVDAIEGEVGEVRVIVAPPAPVAEMSGFQVGRPDPARQYAVISVEDTGKGMTEATLAKILEPYFTTKESTGTGLGLAIVSSIVADNGGLLQVTSAPGQGTRFALFWPVAEPQGAASPAQVQKRQSGRSLPIMVLDDAPDVAAAVASGLAQAGFEVAEINDPFLALEAIGEDPGDWGCLITDYDMPGLNGGDVIHQLADIAPDIPVIVVSALARRLTDPRLAGAKEILQKPVPNAKLVAAVSRATGVAAEEEGSAREDSHRR